MLHGFDFLSVISDVAVWANQRLADGGPRYSEFHPEFLIVEPWNAISSVFMMAPAVYCALEMRGQNVLRHKMVIFAIAMVFLGGLGSTLFHAFRMSPVFLMMDVLPSALLTITLSIYFWLRVLRKWWYVFLIFIPVFALRFWMFRLFEGHIGINISYAISGLLIIVPLAIFLSRTHYEKLKLILLAIVFFALALLFRQLDVFQQEFLPQGTHFLWHLFSAAGSYYILAYLIYIDDKEVEKPVDDSAKLEKG